MPQPKALPNLNEPLTTPVAQPIEGLGNSSPSVSPRITTIRVIDWLRPDHALLRGMAMKHEPKPYEERYAHQGKKEMARRVKQIAKGFFNRQPIGIL